VGRGGGAILKDIPNSLHIRLIAPIDFRVNGVVKRHQVSKTEAKRLTLEMDKKRAQLRDEFAGKHVEDNDYDLIINCERLTTENIVDIITKAAEVRRLV